jgi:hypothetical protein
MYDARVILCGSKNNVDNWFEDFEKQVSNSYVPTPHPHS